MTPEQTAKQLRLAADLTEHNHPFEARCLLSPTEKWVRRNGEPHLYIGTHEICPILATPPDGSALRNEDELTAEQVGIGFRLTVKDDAFSNAAEVWNSARKEWRKTSTESFDPVYTYRLPLSVPRPEKPDPYADLKAAHAAGKVIQAINDDGDWKDITYSPPFWNLAVGRYRIKPSPVEVTKPDAPPPITEEQRKQGYEQYGFGPAITIAEPPPFQLPPPPPGMQWQEINGWILVVDKPEPLQDHGK